MRLIMGHKNTNVSRISSQCFFNSPEARCAFFTNTRFLIKITSDSQIAQSGSQHFSGRTSNPSYFVYNKYFDKKLPDIPALAAFSVFGLTFF